MKDYKTLIGLTMMCCMLAVLAIPFQAQGDTAVSSITTKLDLPYVSKYVWRGLVANPDPAFQPSLTFTHKSGASLNLWASLDATDVNREQGHPTEIDYTGNYAWTLGKLGMNAGLIDYTFPNTAFASTKEVYASASLSSFLSPTLSVNYDYDQADGYYASLSGSYSTPMASTSATFSARVSYATSNYNKLYFRVPQSAFTDLLLSASVPFTVGKSMTITPALSYSTILDSSLRDAVTDPDNFFTSLTASFAF